MKNGDLIKDNFFEALEKLAEEMEKEKEKQNLTDNNGFNGANAQQLRKYAH